MDIREACFRGLPAAKKMIVLHKCWREAVRSGEHDKFEIAWDMARYGTELISIHMEEDIRGSTVPSLADATILLERVRLETDDFGFIPINGIKVWDNKRGVDALAKELADEWQEKVLKENGLRC